MGKNNELDLENTLTEIVRELLRFAGMFLCKNETNYSFKKKGIDDWSLLVLFD